MSTNPQDLFNAESSPDLLIKVPRDAVIISQDELIEKVKQWQSLFSTTTARLNEKETSLGLSRWRIHCALTGTYREYERILKLIHNTVDLLGEEPLSSQAHEAFKTFINNTQPQKVPSPLDIAFQRDLTSHKQFAGVISEEELKSTLVAYLNINPKEQQGVGLNLSCNEYSLTITRVGNRIQLVDSLKGIPISMELPQKGTAAANELELTSAVNMLYENLISKLLHIGEEERSDYHNFHIDAYSPKSRAAQNLHLNPTELVTAIYDKRKDTLDQQDEHSKTNALISAVQNGNSELVQFLERALGKEKLDLFKRQAFEVAVQYGQYQFVNHYYKKEYVDQNLMAKAYSSANQQVINFLLDEGHHRFEKNEFEKSLVKAAENSGQAFNLLLQYYDRFHKEQPELIDPTHFITENGTTLLNSAAENNNIEALEMLLARYDKDKNVKLFLPDKSGKNCLHYLSVHQTELFVAIARRNPELLFVKDKQGDRPIFHLYKVDKELSANIYPLLIEKGQWYEAYILALVHNEQNIINQCREHITFSAMLKHEGDSRKGANRYVEICSENRFTDGRTLPFIQALADINYREQSQETLHDIYLLALTHGKLDIIKSILAVPTFNLNDLFKDGDMVSAFPWYHLLHNPELFDYIVKNIDISKIDDQKSLTEFYLIALQLKNIDLCAKISNYINDKSALFLPGPESETDPYTFFEKDADLFNQYITAIDFDALLAALNPTDSASQSLALNQVYNLALMHNNQLKYEKCIEKLAKDINFSKSTDDLDVCYQSKNTALFLKLFAMKSPSEDWCKKTFIKCLHEDNYEIAAAILEKFPRLDLVNAQIDSIKGVSEPQHPLWVAIKENNVKRCQFLLEHNADPYMKRLHMISTTLMKEGLDRAPLRELFTSCAKFHHDKLQAQREENLKEKNKTEAHIHDMKDKFAGVVEQLKGYKKWDLSRMPTFLGGPIAFEGVRFPKELKKILDLISNAKSESTLPKLMEYSAELTNKIKSINVKILPQDLKDKLIETINSPNARLVALESSKSSSPATYKEFIQNMRDEHESSAKYSPMS